MRCGSIAREQMPPDLQHAMSQLMEKNSQGTITADSVPRLVLHWWNGGSVLDYCAKNTPGDEVSTPSRLERRLFCQPLRR